MMEKLFDHWLKKAGGGIAAYMAFLAASKVALPDRVPGNDLLRFYIIVTGFLIVVFSIAVLVVGRSVELRSTHGDATGILFVWIMSGVLGILWFLSLVSPSPYLCSWERVRGMEDISSLGLRVDMEGTSRVVHVGQPVVVKPGQTISVTVDLPLQCDYVRSDFTINASVKSGQLRPLSPSQFDYTPPSDGLVDYIILNAYNHRTGESQKQAFNIVIQ